MDALTAFRASPEGRRWQEERGQLPIVAIREQLLSALRESDAVVVSGETGSGKTCAGRTVI